MSDGPHVVAISGSNRDASYTRTALAYALAEAEHHGASTELLDLREFDLPVYDADDNDAGDAELLRERVRDADAVLLGTPMYHGSYSSTLKTALDYCGFDEFENETVGLLAVAGGQFPLLALEHLRTVCRSLNAWVLPYQAAIPNASQQFEGMEFVDDGTAERVAVLGQRIVEYADIQPDPPCFESDQNVGAGDD